MSFTSKKLLSKSTPQKCNAILDYMLYFNDFIKIALALKFGAIIVLGGGTP